MTAVAAVALLLLSVPAGLAAVASGGFALHRATQIRPPLNTHVPQNTFVDAIACMSSASCTAGGEYEPAGGGFQAMAVSRSKGVWRRAAPVRLPANSAVPASAEINALACVRQGDCVAVGDYEYQGGGVKPEDFIVAESHGKWGRAFVPVPPANASPMPDAQLEGVSCLPTGFCAAIGDYVDTAGNEQTMALAKAAGGHWQRGVEVAAPLGAAANPQAFMLGISCPAPGACTAVGLYEAGTNELAMGAVEAGGRWHRAVQLRLPPNATGTLGRAASVSCPTAGSCLAVGSYDVTGGGFRAMSITEANGRFARASEVKALPAGAGTHPNSDFSGVSCVRHVPCVAVGQATNNTGHPVAMYAVRTGGRWTAAFLKLPANAATGQTQLSNLLAVACTATGPCTAVVYYADITGGFRAGAASS